MSSRSAARHSVSINSGYAMFVRSVTGDLAGRRLPDGGRTIACANHRQVTTTPAPYQSGLPRRTRSSWTCSAAAHSAAKSARDTCRFSAGTCAMSATVTSTQPRVTRGADAAQPNPGTALRADKPRSTRTACGDRSRLRRRCGRCAARLSTGPLTVKAANHLHRAPLRPENPYVPAKARSEDRFPSSLTASLRPRAGAFSGDGNSRRPPYGPRRTTNPWRQGHDQHQEQDYSADRVAE